MQPRTQGTQSRMHRHRHPWLWAVALAALVALAAGAAGEGSTAPTPTPAPTAAPDFAITVRTYANASGHWITKVQVERRNEPGGAQSPLRVGVERKGAARLVASVAAAPSPSGALEVDEGLYMFMTHHVTWQQAKGFCEMLGMHLALPDNVTLSHEGRGPFYVGISNLATEGPVLSIFGEHVVAGNVTLERSNNVCGVGLPGRLLLASCWEHLPFLCDSHEHRPAPELHVGRFLGTPAGSD